MSEDITFDKDIFEESKCLLTKNIYSLIDCIDVDKNTFSGERKIPKCGGIYAFWWIGDIIELEEALSRNFKGSKNYTLKGKQGKGMFHIKFTQEWLNCRCGSVCLYVGKTTDLKSRIPKHLKLQTESIWPNGGEDNGKKPNSVSQLRIGLEKVFDLNTLDDLKNIIPQIAVSWIKLDGYENAINRFYLENYFIGKYLPLFNVDIER